MLALGYYVFYNVLAMKVVFMGTPDYVVPVLNSIQGEVDLVGVFTAPDRAKGRHGTLLSSPVKEVALSKNIDVFQPTTLRDHAEQANLSYKHEANIDHFPPYECPRIPIRLASTSGRWASTCQALAAAQPSIESGCTVALSIEG